MNKQARQHKLRVAITRYKFACRAFGTMLAAGLLLQGVATYYLVELFTRSLTGSEIRMLIWCGSLFGVVAVVTIPMVLEYHDARKSVRKAAEDYEVTDADH